MWEGVQNAFQHFEWVSRMSVWVLVFSRILILKPEYVTRVAFPDVRWVGVQSQVIAEPEEWHIYKCERGKGWGFFLGFWKLVLPSSVVMTTLETAHYCKSASHCHTSRDCTPLLSFECVLYLSGLWGSWLLWCTSPLLLFLMTNHFIPLFSFQNKRKFMLGVRGKEEVVGSAVL